MRNGEEKREGRRGEKEREGKEGGRERGLEEGEREREKREREEGGGRERGWGWRVGDWWPTRCHLSRCDVSVWNLNLR